jgi:DNA-binding GntR family transcriptional regulator
MIDQHEGEFLPRRSIREDVFQFLHSRIVEGKYAPGEWLRQEDISTHLGVSQTPVREALDLLVSAGLAERVPYKGVRVLQLTTEEIVDAYVLRLVLESTAGRMAACNIRQDQIQALYQILEQTVGLVTLQDMSTQRQLNKRFHQSIILAGENSLLSRLYDTVANRFPDWMLYESMFRHPEFLETSLQREYQEHKAIADAIAAHDPDRAAEKIIEHIHNLGKEFEQFLGIPGDIIHKKESQTAFLMGST